MPNEIEYIATADFPAVLLKEINRVLEIKKNAESLPGNVGLFLSESIRVDLLSLIQCLLTNDLASVLRCYQVLKEYQE